MPKETVYSDVLPFEDEIEISVAEVTWTRHEHVQLVTRSVLNSTGASVTESRYPAQPFEAGVYVQLGRQQVNDLIKNLRRARDQAFGRDE